MYLPTIAELDAAAIVYAGMPPTAQYSWPMLNAALGTEVIVHGADVNESVDHARALALQEADKETDNE